MVDPIFWLGLSILLVAISLTAVLVAALPAFRELARAARSAEKLFDTLSRELPPTLESIRLTGAEISDLTDDMSNGVQGAGRVVSQLDQGLSTVKTQAKQAQSVTRSVVVGLKAAWRVLNKSPQRPDRTLPAGDRPSLNDFAESEEEDEAVEDRSIESARLGSVPSVPAHLDSTHAQEEPLGLSHIKSLSDGDRLSTEEARHSSE